MPPRPSRHHASRVAPKPPHGRLIVALGASAGGLEALGHVLEGLPEDFPAPILVALHLDPHHRSRVVAILQERTRLKVRTARGGVTPKPGRVYIAPPDRHLEIHLGRIRLSRAQRVSYSRPSIDVLFLSVAAAYGPAATVAILSGTGSDGTVGLAAVKARGGTAVAEHASTAAFPGMPEAAGRTGLLDAVLPVEQIPAFLRRSVRRGVDVTPAQWRRMLEILEQRTGAKFAMYRASTLRRRLQQRMAARDSRSVANYLRLLETDATEADRLQAAFLIKVSAFRRDAAAWQTLEAEIPAWAARRPGGSVLRAWSAGCATGEEAYTIAMVLARTLGTGPESPWKVFATDLDDGALRIARAGRYTDSQVRALRPAERSRFFVRDGRQWRVAPVIRGRVVFGRHDLLRDPPLSKIGLLACRNVLIYFTRSERDAALRRLSLAVVPGGILFLGRSENLRPVTGFERIAGTNLFRRETLPQAMAPAGKRRSLRPRTNGVAAAGARKTAQGQDRAAKRPGKPQAGDDRLSVQEDLNEELQSRNEELETVNEELQSLNDELSTMEEQMRGLSEESHRANEFLRLLIDTSTDVLIACDATNRVTFWSKSAIKRFRLSPAQAVGSELFDLVPAIAVRTMRDTSRKARAATKGARIVLRHEGSTFRFDPLPGPAGKKRGYLLRVTPGV